jgi:hypothetical protein
MTIVLTYPTPQGDNLADNDGGNGVNAPPEGAPEGNATATVNDIQRYDKTCIKQNVENIDTINQALGTMAEQDASAVAITGGTIDAAVSVAEAVNATQLGGVTLQALFDLIYPVTDSVVLRHIETPPPAWPGISATWTLIAEGFYPKFINSGQTVGETFGSTTTDPAVLTEAQIPAHEHALMALETAVVDVTPLDTEFAARLRNIGNSFDYDLARSPDQTPAAFAGVSATVGGGLGHDHDFDPPTYRLAIYRRTA